MNIINIVIVLTLSLVLFIHLSIGSELVDIHVSPTNIKSIKILNIGDSCNPLNDGELCRDGSYCPSTLNGTSSTRHESKCTVYKTIGDECNDDTLLCELGLVCYAWPGTYASCHPYKVQVNGDDCVTSEACKGQLECIDLTCQLPANVSCQVSYECPYDHYCIHGLCIQKLQEMEPCLDSVQCQLGLSCSPGTPSYASISFCVKTFSKQLNQSCSSSNSFYSLDGYIPQIDCDSGLVCIDRLCIPPPTYNTNNNHNNNNCTNDNDCPLYPDYQKCNQVSNRCVGISHYNDQCKDSITKLAQCAIENQCNPSPLLMTQDSCLLKYCHKIICNDQCSESELKPPYGYCLSYSSSAPSFLSNILLHHLLSVLIIIFIWSNLLTN